MIYATKSNETDEAHFNPCFWQILPLAKVGECHYYLLLFHLFSYVDHSVTYEEVCRYLLYFVNGKNDSWDRHVPYISIEKLLVLLLAFGPY